MMTEEWFNRFLYVFVGLAVPLILLGTNLLWNYGTILLTIVTIIWIGFALLLLSPSNA
jgi:hypothetical protein